MRNKIAKFKKGIGNEIITVGIMLLCCAFIVGIVTWFGGYTASMEAQIVSDAIADGSVAFSRMDMQLYDKAFSAMADKLYNKNAEFMKELGFCSLTGHGGWDSCIQPITSASMDNVITNAAEKKYLNDRAVIKSGQLLCKAYVYDPTSKLGQMEQSTGTNFSDEVRQGSQDLWDKLKSEMRDYYRSYSGPAYNDAIVTVKITANSATILGKEFPRSASSTILFRANIPNNMRATQSASGSLYNSQETLKKAAYSGVMDNDGNIDINSGNLPVRGSIQAKAIENAIRHLGDAYNRYPGIKQCDPWPVMTLNAEWLNLRSRGVSSQTNNEHKDCYMFVSACYTFDENGQGLSEGALTKYAHDNPSRKVYYEKIISAADLWDELHPIEEPLGPKWGSRGILAAMDAAESNGYSWGTNKSKGIWQGSGHEICYVNGKGGISTISIDKYTTTDANGNESNPFIVDGNVKFKIKGSWRDGFILVSGKPTLTFEEAYNKYACGNGSVPLWKFKGENGNQFSEKWTPDMLEPGDVLIYTDPNFAPFAIAEIQCVWNLTEKNLSALLPLDNPENRSFVCHYNLYIGNGIIAECTEGEDGKTGGQTTALYGLDSHYGNHGTMAIQSFIRFAIVSPKDTSGSAVGTAQDFIDAYEEYLEGGGDY